MIRFWIKSPGSFPVAAPRNCNNRMGAKWPTYIIVKDGGASTTPWRRRMPTAIWITKGYQSDKMDNRLQANGLVGRLFREKVYFWSFLIFVCARIFELMRKLGFLIGKKTKFFLRNFFRCFLLFERTKNSWQLFGARCLLHRIR